MRTLRTSRFLRVFALKKQTTRVRNVSAIVRKNVAIIFTSNILNS